MSLTSALQSAQASLQDISSRVGTVTRNLNNSDNENYARRVALPETTATGGVRSSIVRQEDVRLDAMRRNALTSAAGDGMLADRLQQLSFILNGVDGEGSVSSAVDALQNALSGYRAAPNDPTLALGTVDAARSVVSSLNRSAADIAVMQDEIGADIEAQVVELRDLLSRFQTNNEFIQTGKALGRDVTDAMDERGALLDQIGQIIPVNASTDARGNTRLTTSSGITLFDRKPRDILIEVSSNNGGAARTVYIDGLALAAPTDASGTSVGKLGSLLYVGDSVLPRAAAQLDEAARGLLSAFAETDQTGVDTAKSGLFFWSGGPDLPADGTHVGGLAATIAINAAFDPLQGGSPHRLRDGGANGAAYSENTAENASFSDRLDRLVGFFSEPFAIDPNTGGDGSAGLGQFIARIASGAEVARAEIGSRAERSEALQIRLTGMLSSKTGVNTDQELAVLMDLQNAYEASARIMSVVDEMFTSLFQSMR